MKREIKFRAWDKFEGKWLFGYEYPNLGGFSLIGEVVLFGELAKFSLDYYQHIIFMQFTGLQDKNGKDIYEGDWCTAMFRTKEGIQVIQGQIIMDDFMWCIDCTGCLGDDIFSINRPHNFEIIGNIYETPDLLK